MFLNLFRFSLCTRQPTVVVVYANALLFLCLTSHNWDHTRAHTALYCTSWRFILHSFVSLHPHANTTSLREIGSFLVTRPEDNRTLLNIFRTTKTLTRVRTFSQFLLVLEPVGGMVQFRYIHGWNILYEHRCERGQILGTFREVIQGC